jgi:acetyltransferase-like isoleucine patch superfamily enzyme
MRVIRWRAIAVFSLLLAPVVGLAAATARWCGYYLHEMGELHGVAVAATTLVCFYAYAIAQHRLLLWIAPLREGRLLPGGDQEFRYQVYILYYLFLLNTLIRCRAIPIPVMRLVYLALGARLGANTYSAGTIFDPIFVTIGANTLVGESALLVPHVIEGSEIAHYRIAIGDNVTIGAQTVVLAGVTIGDNAIIGANSVVTKGSCVRAGETWSGTPARCSRPGAVDGRALERH